MVGGATDPWRSNSFVLINLNSDASGPIYRRRRNRRANHEHWLYVRQQAQ
jgi:hypothetical protein